MTTTAGTRAHDLDWLRVVGMFAVFLFHCSQFFNPWPWHVKNNVTVAWVEAISLFLNLWIMPLFFVLSGASAALSLRIRTPADFLRERAARLAVPLVLGVLVLAPPQVYAERASQGQFAGSLVQFLPHYFSGWYGFGGNFAWMGLHLWYLLILFIFSVATLPLARGLAAGSLERYVRHPAVVLLLALPLALPDFLLHPEGAGIRAFGGWNLFVYLLLYLYGVAFFPGSGFRAAIRKLGRYALAGGVVTTVALVAWMWLGFTPFGRTGAYALLSLLRVLNAWCWILGLSDLAQRYLNFRSAALGYWNQALMPFYVLHQTVIVSLGFLIRGLDWGVPLKALVLVAGSFAAIMGLYQFLVRPVPILAFLFGMKFRGESGLRLARTRLWQAGAS